MIMKGMGIYQLLASVFFGGMILHFAGPFLIPLAYAFLIAVVLFPICAYFESRGFGKVLSIVLPLIILFIFFSVLVLFLSYELVILSEKWPMIQAKLDPMLNQIQQQLEIEFGWTAEKQLNWIRGYLVQMSQNTGAYLKETANAIFSALFNLIIIPIYVSLILVYRRSLVRFVIDISAEHYRAKMKEVILETVKVFSGFIRGMVTVYIVVGILNSFGLWVIGVENPILYGMVTAIMTIIPVFGILISALLPITIAWLETGALWQPLGIAAVFTIVQYLEANLIFPYVVGRFVNLNTLVAIVSIFLGGLFWGFSGMILFLPFVAVFRLFADHFPELKPWSKLLSR
jgi:predicted PurR-regulated permease PerM